MAQHRLAQIDTEKMTAACRICGPVPVRLNGTRPDGKIRYRCDTATRERILRQEAARRALQTRDRTLRYPSRALVADRLLTGVCERCGFRAEDPCQLDVDHRVRRVDGGETVSENLVVLCANCHRLKTKHERLPGWDVAQFMASLFSRRDWATR